MELMDFSQRRWEQRPKFSTDGYQPAGDDYFCWRWCKKQLSSFLNAYTIPSDGMLCRRRVKGTQLIIIEIILQSILCNDDFFGFHIDYLYVRNDNPEFSIVNEMLDVYGDDPKNLVYMWNWAKSADAVSKRALSLINLPGCPPSLNAFYSQLRQDAMKLGISKADVGILRGSLSAFLTMKNLIEFRLVELGVKFSDENCDLSFLETTRTISRSTEEFSNVSIQYSVADSGKTQHVFNQLYQNWGHYLVSGRVPNEASPDFLLTARRGMASLDTSTFMSYLARTQTTRSTADV